MGMLEDGLKGVGPSLLVTVGAVLAAPIVIPAVMGGLRPLAKMAIKSYLAVSDSLRETFAEAGEQISDLVAEVRAESGAETAAPAGTSTEARQEAKQEDASKEQARKAGRT